MDEYIKREAVLEILRKKSPGTYRGIPCYPDEISASFREINKLPAADVVEVRHGRWVEHDRFICNSDGKPVAKIDTIFICSECGREENYKEPYCHCGARMDGDGSGPA